MRVVLANGIAVHWREDGDPQGVPVLFANSLGTDMRLWDAVIPQLPHRFRCIRYDMRGHGLSGETPEPYDMGTLIADAEALIATLDLKRVVFVGLSIGGMIGQGLAAKRPDLVKALVLSNTAVKMGTPEMWRERMAQVAEDGIAGIADAVLERWFAPPFLSTPEAFLWRAMLSRTPEAGYLGCCAAIAETDLTESTKALNLPVMGIAGSDDGASPAEVVAATCALIKGASCHIIPKAGHLPCIEAPMEYAAILATFLKEHYNG
jgi:3-oxoadipate enol-lactonase